MQKMDTTDDVRSAIQNLLCADLVDSHSHERNIPTSPAVFNYPALYPVWREVRISDL